MANFTPDTSNTLFQLAAGLVNQTNRSIFLTGKAGTGKTTFLKYIRENCPKQMAVVAPTGVAAINAGGVTIHSFFQLPLAPFIPQKKGTGYSGNPEAVINPHSLLSRLRMNNDKRKLLQQLELLVIDEISMVRCDLLDAVDTVLRHFRHRPLEKFGGVQLLFIGDMFQLPPVVKEDDWKFLGEFYESPFFFSSHVLREEPPLYIEFEKIYRQQDETFIRLLNQVRNNELDEDGSQILESRYQPVFRRTKNDNYIILTTHNEQARIINTAELSNLEGAGFRYEAAIKDDFPSNAYPADEILLLKEGAQVMFIRNDSSDKGKRYYNGKIGKVTRLEEETVFVRCPGDQEDIKVTREAWDNIRYTLDKVSQNMKEDLLGSFSQFPLRLAWAITIHKSQGLTFEKAIIDAGEAFAPGQVYVALSRCTSLEGMVLKSRLKTNKLFTDPRIVQFSRQQSGTAQLREEMEKASLEYQRQLLLDVFNYQSCLAELKSLRGFLLENQESFSKDSISWMEQLQQQLGNLEDTGFKFRQWLQLQFARPGKDAENPELLERTKKAVLYFEKECGSLLGLISQSPGVTDSKQNAKEFNESVKSIFTLLASRRHLLTGLEAGRSPEEWHRKKREFSLPAFSVNAYATASQKPSDSPHPLLLRKLRELRDNICDRKNLPVYLVLSSNSLQEMARYLPQSLTELRKITGFGDTKLAQYGQAFLDIILGYCQERELESRMHEKSIQKEKKDPKKKAPKKGDTYAHSLELYRKGKSITEIAAERNLTTGTIEGHLARYVRSQEIPVVELVSADKIERIEKALAGFNGISVTPVKEQLGDSISYGEIRLVMAHLGIQLQHSAEQ